MAERTPVSVEVSERRLEGYSFADCLGGVNGVDLKAVPCGDPSLLFEQVILLSSSEDRAHALAMGRDEYTLTLLRDGEPVLSGEFFKFDIGVSNSDFSRLFVIGRRSRSEDIAYFIDGDKDAKQVYTGTNLRVLAHKEFEFFLMKKTKGSHTLFEKVYPTGHKLSMFKVRREFDSVKVYGLSGDFSQVVIYGWDLNRANGSVFRNHQLLAEGTNLTVHKVSQDLSRVLIVRDNADVIAYERRSAIHLDDVHLKYGGAVETAGDLELAIVDLKTAERGFDKHKLLIWSAGERVRLTDSFDKLDSLTSTDDMITAKFSRNGVPRELTVRLNREDTASGQPVTIQESTQPA